MPHATSLGLAFASGALVLSRFERRRLAATMLGGLAGATAAFVLLGYLIGIDTLYGSASVSSPALPTFVALLCIASAIVLRLGMMPVLRKSRPLWHLLVMLGCATVVPLLLFGVYAGFRTADAQLRDVREKLAIEARALSANVDRDIIGEMERLQALAASSSLRHGDFAEFQRQAEASLGLRQSGDIVLIDRNMQQLVNTFVPSGKPLPKVVVRKPIEKTFATGKPQVTGLFMAPFVNQFIIGVTVPVEVDGESRYVLGKSQDQRALARLVAANELPPGWSAVVSDDAHQIIARSEQEGLFIGKELPPAQWHRAGPSGSFEFIDSSGRASLEASVTSELTGWQTAVWAPKALLEASVRAQWRTLGVMALLAIALVVGSALWLGRIVARSVGQAARAAIAAGEGTSLPPSRTPVAEVNTLMAELQERTSSLRESEATFRAMFDVSSVGKIEVEHKSGRFLRANAAMCKFVGYSEAELLARTVFDITHPDERERDRAFLQSMVAGQSAAFDMEKRYVRKDGEVV
jgi:PAS domain S-box-containing protein